MTIENFNPDCDECKSCDAFIMCALATLLGYEVEKVVGKEVVHIKTPDKKPNESIKDYAKRKLAEVHWD